MKKIFSLFATALVALFGLTCCGGGGGGSDDPGYMSIEDFACGTKKFVTGYNMVMEIIPTPGGKYTPTVTDTKATFVEGIMVAGDSQIPIVCTSYEMPEKDARSATLEFSVTDNADDLADKDFLTGLGFATLVTDEASGTAIVLPNALTSISGMRCILKFYFDAQRMETEAHYVDVEVTADGKKLLYEEIVKNGSVPFAVYPR